LVPGIIALLSDTIGFLTLLAIDIGIIRELAITASLGVAVVILTNLILLPVIASFIRFKPSYIEQVSKPTPAIDALWDKMAVFAKPNVAMGVVAVSILLYILAANHASQMRIGDLHAGAPALHESSRYNQDTALITDRYAITSDILKVIVETKENACTYHDVMGVIDEFQWRLENIEGVQSGISLPSVAKQVNAGYNEGNVNWHTLPRNKQSLVQASARVETSTGLLNSDCSVMPIVLFLEDHKAETIDRVVAQVKILAKQYENEELKFKLASGPVGVMAATNEAVSEAQTPMMWYVYGAVIILCLLSFRSIRATISVVLPLYLVSTMAQALMVELSIGLTVSTLPVIALGVGIGVDYGIYVLANMSPLIAKGMNIHDAYYQALRERGSAVIFTGITLAIGVSTWVFSALKFQMDMGILLTFMFVVNMLGAIIVLPALSALLWRNNTPN
jgi:predicted RND superfamily exporter protein